MDDAKRARLFACVDETMELVELDIREDDDGWWLRINSIAARKDGSLEAIVRMMSRIGAASAVALSAHTGIELEEVLRRSRLALLDDIERWS